MRFGEKWVGWIEAVFKSIRISILINGSPTKEISPRRGIRQGDPISPLLFLIVGEILNCMISEAVNKDILSGISIANLSSSVSHLQFTDDTILFIRKDLKSVQGIKRVLQCFELISGLKINFHKSSLYGYHTEAADLRYWPSCLGCQIGRFPISYLGMQLGLNPRNKVFWAPIIKIFNSNLAS